VLARPLQAAVVSALSFAVGAALPLIVLAPKGVRAAGLLGRPGAVGVSGHATKQTRRMASSMKNGSYSRRGR
jgi:hypothetical protein